MMFSIDMSVFTLSGTLEEMVGYKENAKDEGKGGVIGRQDATRSSFRKSPKTTWQLLVMRAYDRNHQTKARQDYKYCNSVVSKVQSHSSKKQRI